jgi:hypothetical protein
VNGQITFTEILGFSQTYQWYTGEPFKFPTSDPTFTPQKVFLSKYNTILNCQVRFGGDLTRWKDPNFVGYEGHVVHNIRKERQEITRLMFNVSGESRIVYEWTADIESAIDILLKKYPHLQELYLQPVIGGVDHTSNVCAVKNQPDIIAAINTVVKNASTGLLKAGAVVRLENEGFSDMIGHLTVSGAQKARELIFKFYNITA